MIEAAADGRVRLLTNGIQGESHPEGVAPAAAMQPGGKNGCVLYVMSRDVRVADNHALLTAQAKAKQQGLPLLVAFIAYAQVGLRAREHFTFLFAGLEEVAAELKRLGIAFVIRSERQPHKAVKQLMAECRPAAVYFDFSPLRGPQTLHRMMVRGASVPVYEVDTHNVVPVWLASDKQEYAARTLRSKLHRRAAEFLVAPAKLERHPMRYDTAPKGLSFASLHRQVVSQQRSNGTRPPQQAGERAALAELRSFINERLSGYATGRNDPLKDQLSDLSPYLHYGNISSLRVMLEVEAAVSRQPALRADADALFEEMVVRKELSDNFCFYTRQYDVLVGAPAWARQTLAKHADDPREHLYSREQLERAETADPAWNAAQRQMLATGKMHGYMRMYWAKKVLEWTPSVEEAIDTLVYLNDFYMLDGGDPNGYVGILWSVAGLHDRPWGERAVFGTVRYMNYAGLKRKFDIAAYEQRWSDGSA